MHVVRMTWYYWDGDFCGHCGGPYDIVLVDLVDNGTYFDLTDIMTWPHLLLQALGAYGSPEYTTGASQHAIFELIRELSGSVLPWWWYHIIAD